MTKHERRNDDKRDSTMNGHLWSDLFYPVVYWSLMKV